MGKIFLFEQWNSVLKSCPTTDYNASKSVYDQLVTIYTGDDRHHHGIKHITHYVTRLRDLFSVYQFNSTEIDKCIMGAFFHDVEYNTKKPSDSTNIISDEELSAMYARNALKQIGFDEDFITDVSNLILLTESHKPNESLNIDPLLQSIFIDADMAILGEEPFLYIQYSDAIKEEYKNIDPETFILGRKNFLTKLYKHKTIFLTEYMNELYNDQAHSNIDNEINDLNKLYVELLTSPKEV